MDGAWSTYGDTGIWWGNLRERDHIGRPRHRCKDNFRMGLQEMGCGGGGMDWIKLAKDRYRWWSVVSAIMNLWFP